uniref:Uncharacterized protein n=1 Tax=Candidatus Kentrum sp. TC TaxID=2126339 RepID=A0A450Z5K8_9GAMM|nr:MAG: Protein of unknown function (DUF3486) [Candidatus Kentron sp. TC]
MTKSSLLQKKWAMDTREKAERAAMEVASIGKKAGLSDEYADEIRRKILGVAS